MEVENEVILGNRAVWINNDVKNLESKFPSNKTSTTKYTYYNFIFNNLFEQFRRLANFYFLVIVIIELFPSISPLSPLASIFPLVFVLCVTAAKDGYEDYKRHKADNEVNMNTTRVLKEEEWVVTRWMDVVVGNIVQVRDNEQIPADVVPLSSSDPLGDVFVETSNLDGETGNKLRHSVSATKKYITNQQLSELRGFIATSSPTLLLENFDATFVTENNVHLSLKETNLLLRGARLKSTSWVNTLVVYTGEETKLVLNQQDAPSKFTHVEKRLNKYILGLFLSILLLCSVSSVVGLFWQINAGSSYTYLELDLSETSTILLSIWKFIRELLTFFVLYSNFIPISLYVSIEFVKFCGAILLSYDNDFYDADTESGLVVKTSNLLEELGQVTHVFSDKTGTLTENKMTLRKCSIKGHTYHCAIPDEKKNPFSEADDNETVLSVKVIQKRAEIHQFLLAILINNSISVKELEKGVVEFSSSSPDEEALVNGITKYGYHLSERTREQIVLKVQGQEYVYEVLEVIDFTSSRKRMSIIIRDTEGNIQLLCKGADNIIFERLENAKEKKILKTQNQVDNYSTKGLRTLCYAYRPLSDEIYNKWNQEYIKASTINDSTRKDKVEEIAEKIEKNLILLGATAIEDKLQENVPETLQDLLRAQIKIWVLTGDKQQTAICIGKSCNLIIENTILRVVNVNSEKECLDVLRNFDNSRNNFGDAPLALIIDGKSLSFALSHDEVKSLFLSFSMHCTTVICCRVSPIQKAQVVALVKKNNPSVVTLSIGDGANDVSMIQEADVGIGIRGREGSQASRSADFSIAKFRYLKKLLFVHGRYTYVRVAQLIQYSFYKNVAFITIQFYFAFFNGFSGQSLIDSWVISVFNLFFTSWPILIFAMFEKDVQDVYLQKYPELYNRTQNNTDFTLKTFYFWMVNAIWHSLVFYFGTYLLWDSTYSDGTTYDLWSFGNMAVSTCIVTVTLRLAIDTLYWPWMMFVCSIGSVIIYFIFLIVYGYIYGIGYFDPLYLLFINQAKFANFWLTLLILVIIAVLPDFCQKWLKQHLYPKDWQILKEKIMVDKKRKSKETINMLKKEMPSYGSTKTFVRV